MPRPLSIFVGLACMLISMDVLAENAAPYAGQQAREISSLAAEEIDGLLNGAGLGYAKAAELNGWPGPLHVLELAEELDLSAEQQGMINTIRQNMLLKARPLGKDVIAAEQALDRLFADGDPDPADIAEATSQIGLIEAELRAVHLAAHIETKPILTRHQRMLYAQLRGYGSAKGAHQGHHKH